MTADNSIRKRSRRKPAKPYPNFPLFAHAVGYRAKKTYLVANGYPMIRVQQFP